MDSTPNKRNRPKEYWKAYYQANKEKIKERGKARSKIYYQLHREEISAKRKAAYKKKTGKE